MTTKFFSLVGAAILGSAITFGGVKLLHLDGGSNNNNTKSTFAVPSVLTNFSGTSGAAPDFTTTAEAVMPMVVHIKATEGVVTASRSPRQQQPQQRGGSPFDFFFNNPFGGDDSPFDGGGQGFGQSEPKVGSGSGVVISADGYIVTNNHVVVDADKLDVTMYNNQTYTAKVIGTDPSTDLALIKIEAKDLPFMELANSDNSKVGEWVLAVGNPFNLTYTVTAGIISAKGRNIHIIEDKSALESFIQTDAAINPGNSGGALVDMKGNLVGINSAIATPTGTYAGYGFAVPANLVKKVIDDLLDFGVVQRGFLGVLIQDVDGELAKKYNLNVSQGVYVDSLLAEGSAINSGLKEGDVIVKVDGAGVKSSPELQEKIGRHRPGDKVIVTVDRRGSLSDVSITLKNKKGNTDVVKKDEAKLTDVLGAEFEALDAKMLKKYGVENGVQVKTLSQSGKLARYTDMQEGFIITAIDRQAVKTVADVEKALSGKNGGVLIEGVYPGYSNKYYYGFGM